MRIVCEKHNTMRAPEHEECLQCRDERLAKKKVKKVEVKPNRAYASSVEQSDKI